MASPIGVLQKALNDLRSLIWHYEEGLEARIIALYKDAHPGEERSDSNILHEERNKCHRSRTHHQISTHLTNIDTGITHLGDIVQELKDRLATKSQEYHTLCDKVHMQKAIIKDCKAAIAAMAEEDQRKADSIATLQVALADKTMDLVVFKDDQQGGQVDQVKGLGDYADKDPQSSAIAKNATLVLMERVGKLEEELKVKEIEVEALRIAEGCGSNGTQDDKMARWEMMTDKIMNDLHKMEQEFSLSRSLAMQNQELRDSVITRELTIASLSREVVELKALLRHQPQGQSSIDLYSGFDHEARIKPQANANALAAEQLLESHVRHLRRSEMSPSTRMIFAQTAGSTDGPIHSPRSDDDEQEDIFEDCVAEQGGTTHADADDDGTGSTYSWPDISISGTGDATQTVSKNVWQDLSGLDLLGDE
ncbi:hypothetical protein DV737_g5676, partial [Chaetothyriales sp. CBS 132003]